MGKQFFILNSFVLKKGNRMHDTNQKQPEPTDGIGQKTDCELYL